MSILKEIFNIKDIKSPIFLKEFSDESNQINQLENLKSKIEDKNTINLISKDVNSLKEGLLGEQNVYYELKNSYIPMLCLHNIRIESEGNVAQLDFVLITHYFIMILETKKLSGDITINEAGEFTRTIKNKYGKALKKEGIYSPISQNERHVRILKDYLLKNNLIRTFPIISSVIIANPKSIINRYKAPYDIKNKIFKSDQLTTIINKELKKHIKSGSLLESRMYKIVNFLLDNHIEYNYDYYKRYSISSSDFITTKKKVNTTIKDNVNTNRIAAKDIIVKEDSAKVSDSNIELREFLRKYRYKKAQEEKVKAYFIFNDKVLDELVIKKPNTLKSLLEVRGLGDVKVSKYGLDLLDIIKCYN